MTVMLTSLGRETPYLIDSVQNAVIVCYQDAISVYERNQGKEFDLQLEAQSSTEACLILGGSQENWQVVVSEGPLLRIYDQKLQSLRTLSTEQEEDITALVALSRDSFLAVSDVSSVTYWARESADSFVAQSQWLVECRPLFAKGNGKTVICSERGRIQERDSKTGTVLHTWPNSTLAEWGTADPSGHHALTINGKGEAVVWDMSSRELLFGLSTNFPVSHALFDHTGLAGTLLGAGGEMALFKLVDGGETEVLEAPDTPVVSLVYHQSELLGIDENGALWSFRGGEPSFCGGSWAGWATCSCFAGPSRVLVGTATGSLEFFDESGRRTLAGIQLHHDAIVALELWEQDLISVGADGTVLRITNLQGESPQGKALADFNGRSVVGHSLCRDSGTLWVGLEEGLVAWLSLSSADLSGEFQLPGRRIEEIRSAGPGKALVLTERGSAKHLRIEP